MLLKFLLPSLLTTAVVRAFPSSLELDADVDVVGDILLDEEYGEFEVFKRDSVLDARDLELAEMHGVNLTEMYKHSHIKRDNEDHINIWVSRSFDEQDEEDEGDLVKRQRVRLGNNAGLRQTSSSDTCGDHSRDDKTGPNAPYTGGVKAIFNWADNYSGGRFRVGHGGAWQNLVLAGSNSGANALYRVQTVNPGHSCEVGTQDVRNDADWTQRKARKYGSSWRASSTGRETCTGSRIRYQVIRTKYNV